MIIAACRTPDVRRDPRRALSLIESYSSDAERLGAGLVVFPECFLQGYMLDPAHVESTAIDLTSGSFGEIQPQLAQIKPTLVFGLIEQANGRFFNSACVVERGVLRGCYRKVHLLEWEKAVFDPGNDYPVFDVDGLRFGINICNDLNFSEAARAVQDQGATLLVCPSNNMLPRPAAERWKTRHHETRCERARGSGLWIVSSDVCGESVESISYGPASVIDPQGKVVDEVPASETGVVVVDMNR